MAESTKCKGCENELPTKRIRRHSMYCSNECRNQSMIVSRNFGGYIPKGTVGAMAEILVSHDLMRRGYEVFRALSPACSCDLAIIKGHKLVRVEVKTSNLTQKGKIYIPQVKKNTHEVLALVIDRKDIHYLPDIDAS